MSYLPDDVIDNIFKNKELVLFILPFFMLLVMKHPSTVKFDIDSLYA